MEFATFAEQINAPDPRAIHDTPGSESTKAVKAHGGPDLNVLAAELMPYKDHLILIAETIVLWNDLNVDFRSVIVADFHARVKRLFGIDVTLKPQDKGVYV